MLFEDQEFIENIDDSSFNLTISLRSHLSGRVSDFVNYFIEKKLQKPNSSIEDEIKWIKERSKRMTLTVLA